MMKCKFDRCQNLSLSLSEFCWGHLPDKEGYKAKLLEAAGVDGGLAGSNLQKVSFKGVRLERSDLAKANLSQIDLSGSHLFDLKFEGAELLGADLSNCDLSNCDFKDADLTKANLSGSRLWNADLRDSNLTESNLAHSDLWNARLANVKLWHTNLTEAKFLSKRNFASHKFLENPKINESGLLSSEESYRDLKRYFISSGMYNDASWASFKEKTMERLIFRKNRNMSYFPSLLMNILCGYGEKPYRIVLSAISTILLFALIYLSFNAIQSSSDPIYTMGLSDYIYYSAITFTTVGYGDFIPKEASAFRLLAASEAFIGTFLTGLFIFTLARKYSAR